MRNGMIDFMRFVFIIAVVLHHSVLFYAPIIDGYIGVEFFFIVSGYLLTNSNFPHPEQPKTPLL